MQRASRLLAFSGLLAAISIAAAADSQSDRQACASMSTPTDAAIAACTALVENNSLSAQARASALSYRANWNLSKSRMDATLRDLSQAIELDPTSASYRVSRGNFYVSWKKYADAIADFTAVLDKQPDDAEVLKRRSYAYYESGDLDRSIADDTRVIALQPRNAAVFFSRGVSYQDKREFDLARADFNRTLELDRSYYDEFERGCVARNANGGLELRDWPRCEKR